MNKKMFFLSLGSLIFLFSCTVNKNAGPLSVSQTPSASQSEATPFPDADAENSVDLYANKITSFSCPDFEYYGLLDENIGSGLTLMFYKDGTFRISFSETGGDYYYGKFEEIGKNLYQYYGEILDYSKLEACEGEGCYIPPELTDKTIDGYTRLAGDIIFFIPHAISMSELSVYTDDQGCVVQRP